MARTRVFVSYAHEDRPYLDRLLVHLKPLTRRYDFEVWSDRKLEAGTEFEAEITRQLKASVMAVLFVSADFLASDFVMKTELPMILQRAADEGTPILPIIAGPCLFEESDLGRFQAANDPRCTLQDLEAEGASQERAFAQFARAILGKLKEIEQGPGIA